MSRLGDSIRAARLKAKMTEKALGKKCGMAESVIKEIESGRRIVSDEQAQRILKLLGADSPVSTELDVAAEPELNVWDVAALIPIVEQAGGRITGYDGSPALTAGSGLTSNALLHA